MTSTEPFDAFPRLVADVGGTNARFALEVAPMRLEQISVAACRDYPSLEAAMRDYLGARGALGGAVRHAAVGIANPVLGDHVKMTNHSWAFSIEGMRAALGLKTLLVMNDFAALAHALPHLPAHALEQIGGGTSDPHAPRVLLGAGTGLGVSSLIPAGDKWAAVAGEGGHISFSPADDAEMRLWQFARKRYCHVSAERFLSGSGLELIDEALASFEPAEAFARTSNCADAAAPRAVATITALALAGDDARALRALDLFCAMLGTVAADLALVLGARGGVYIGGGIVPRLGDAFPHSPFRRRFEDKGRFEPYLVGIPVYVIHAPFPALIGLCAALSTGHIVA